MKKYILLTLLTAAFLQYLPAQKVVSGDHVEKRAISGFRAIETSSGIEVEITQGDKEELAVSVNDERYLNEVRTVVDDGVLKISRSSDWKFWNQWKNRKVKVYVSYRQLESIRANSGGSVKGADIALTSLSLHANSGGTIHLSGRSEKLEADASSGGIIRGYDLVTKFCRAAANSGGGVQVTVDKEISAKANSGGYVRFKGEGLIRDINVNSGGSVKRQS
jgi:hypothetical protein